MLLATDETRIPFAREGERPREPNLRPSSPTEGGNSALTPALSPRRGKGRASLLARPIFRSPAWTPPLPARLWGRTIQKRPPFLPLPGERAGVRAELSSSSPHPWPPFFSVFNPCSIRGSGFRIGRRGLTKRSGPGNNGRGPERRLGAPGRNGVFRAEVPVFLDRGANECGVRGRQLNYGG